MAPTNNASEVMAAFLRRSAEHVLDEVGPCGARSRPVPAARAFTPSGRTRPAGSTCLHHPSPLGCARPGGWFRPSSNSESSGGGRQRSGSADDGVNASSTRHGVHSDVCEYPSTWPSAPPTISLARELASSPAARGGPTQQQTVRLEHDVGTAFINLCQQRHGVDPLMRGNRDTLVVRGFASKSRAPAEGWRAMHQWSRRRSQWDAAVAA